MNFISYEVEDIRVVDVATRRDRRGNDYTVYVLHSTLGGNICTAMKRYSDLRQLHSEILKLIPSERRRSLPSFPSWWTPAAIFNNTSHRLVQQRLVAHDVYMRKLCELSRKVPSLRARLLEFLEEGLLQTPQAPTATSGWRWGTSPRSSADASEGASSSTAGCASSVNGISLNPEPAPRGDVAAVASASDATSPIPLVFDGRQKSVEDLNPTTDPRDDFESDEFWDRSETEEEVEDAVPSCVGEYDTVKILGVGTYGRTALLKHRGTGELVAGKFIPRGADVNNKYILREILVQRSLSHKNIVAFKGAMLEEQFLVILMEYASGGELYELMLSRGKLTEVEARFFARQIIAGVEYLHIQEIIHRDLKLDNILISDEESLTLKLCDFGFSKSTLVHSIAKSRVGTTAYMAPETLMEAEYDGKLADVWACGVILYVMVFGEYPFNDPNRPENTIIMSVMQARYTLPDHTSVSKEFADLLASIFVTCPTMRISLQGLKQHPWCMQHLGDSESSLVTESAPQQSASTPAIVNMQTPEEIEQLVLDASRR